MAPRVADEPIPVVLVHGDGLMARLAREILRLEAGADAIAYEIEKRQADLIIGLAARNLTRLDVEGIHIRRVRAGVTVT